MHTVVYCYGNVIVLPKEAIVKFIADPYLITMTEFDYTMSQRIINDDIWGSYAKSYINNVGVCNKGSPCKVYFLQNVEPAL